MKKTLLLLAAVAFAGSVGAQQKMSWEEAYKKADEVISKLTTEEKVRMILSKSTERRTL